VTTNQPMPELLYLASKRNVYAVDPFTGDEIWSIKLPKVTGSYVTLHNTPHTLFATRSNGFVYALNKYSGEIIWEKLFKDLRNVPIAIASSQSTSQSSDMGAFAAAAAQQAARAAAAAG